jgi:hypothetical protein
MTLNLRATTFTPIVLLHNTHGTNAFTRRM